MNARVKRYWDEEVRFFKRDLKAGAFEQSWVGGYWDDKIGYRSHEMDPSVTKSQFIAYVNAKMAPKASKARATKVTAAAILNPKKPQKKSTQKQKGFWATLFGR